MNQLFRLPRAKHAGCLVAVVVVNSKTDCTTIPSLVSLFLAAFGFDAAAS